MKRALLAAAVLFACGSAQAGVHACNLDSDYDLRVTAQQLEFSRHRGTPSLLVMRDGSLVIDGQPAALDPADRQRVRAFEHEVRALMPEVRAIALDAAGIAFDALGEVVNSLAGDPAPTLARLEHARAELSAKLAVADDTAAFDEDFLAETVGQLVGEIVPALAGDIASAAIAAAMSGDQDKVREVEARATRMEREIQARVEGAADALELRAQALCPRIAGLDRIDDSLQYRLADGRALDLLRADAGHH